MGRKSFTRRGDIIQVTVEGIQETSRSFKKFEGEVFKIASRSFNKMLIAIRKEIRKETPVDTGTLRNSVKILKNIKRKRQFTGDVGPDGSARNIDGVPYHIFVILGNRGIKPNNFLVRGFKNAGPEIKRLTRDMNKKIDISIRKSNFMKGKG